MAHKNMVGGTAYDTKGGRGLVDGTGYDIKNGRTLVSGTGYDVDFVKMCTVTLSNDSWLLGSETSTHRYVVIDGVKYYGHGTEVVVPAGTTCTIDMRSLIATKHQIWENGYPMYEETFSGQKTYEFVIETDTDISCTQVESGYDFDITTGG